MVVGRRPTATSLSSTADPSVFGQRVTVTATSRPMADWGLGGGVVSTGAPAAAVVRLMARGRIEQSGVLPPEACVDPDDLFAELERAYSEP